MGREGEAWEGEGEAWKGEGEAWEGEGELWEGRVRHRTVVEAWKRKERVHGSEPPPHFPPTPPSRLHE